MRVYSISHVSNKDKRDIIRWSEGNKMKSKKLPWYVTMIVCIVGIFVVIPFIFVFCIRICSYATIVYRCCETDVQCTSCLMF